MEKGLLHKQIRDFFVRNFDVRQEKEDELETIESIKKGIEFKGTNLWVLIFAGFEYELDGGDYRCDVDLPADGSHHGVRPGIGDLRFRSDQTLLPQFRNGDGIQCHHFDAFFPDLSDQRGAERVAGPYAANRL